MKIRVFGILAAVALLALVLAACGGRQTPAEPETQSAGDVVAETTAPVSDTEASEETQDSESAETQVAESEPKTSWTAWVADGMDDDLAVVDVARVPVGVNPHILSASPNGQIIYVINAGAHDRGPGAHGGEEMDADTDDGDEDHHADDSMVGEMDTADDEHGMEEEAMANSLWAIDAANGEVLARIPVGMGPTHPMASTDGSRVYVTNTDEGSVTVIDTASWVVVYTITGLPEPHDGELTPDGKLLYLATAGDSTMTVVDTETFESLKTFKIGQKPRGLAVGGERGEIAYVTNKGDGTLSIIDVANDEVVATSSVGAGAHALRVAPDGESVYIALSGEDAVAVVDAQTGEVHTRIDVGTTPEQLDLSGDGRWLLVSNNGDNTLSIIDTGQNMVVKETAVGTGAYGVQATQTTFTPPVAEMVLPLPDLPRNADGYTDITVEQLTGMMDERDLTLVNVHTPFAGNLHDTDISIPFNEIAENTDKLPAKDAPIVLYCRSGSMSTQAAKQLVQLGYNNVYELDGGFNAWVAAGNELVMSQ